ncbi:MAG: dTDP-4-dehydrorhamnose 3,5-epimerase [Verrucomicrobia bacterium]|nr:dTDP-4-dehydrorhamnose 3,5-epimerase [Verrucomicrobiota bacterium]
MFATCLKLDGLKLIEPRIFGDERGFFLETYRQPLYVDAGIDVAFVQDNMSFSKKGTIRGLHFQTGQAKLVSVLNGKIWDVAVDIRPDSPTFGQWEAVELDDQKRRQFFVPAGFAHGFCILSETALIQYKVNTIYDPKAEGSIRWNDPFLNIPWPFQEPILSQRDQQSPFFQEVYG